MRSRRKICRRPSKLEAYFARDIEILQSRQRDDGSFGLWKRDKERYEYPFLTIHVAHALALAKAKGYKVPDEMINKTKPYLKDIEKHFDEWYKNSPEVRWTISAYALYVRDLMGDKDVGKGRRNCSPKRRSRRCRSRLLGWVLSVLADDPGSQTEVAGDHPPPDEPHDRDGRDRELCHRLWRRRLADHVFEPACRRRAARGADQGRPEERSDPETRPRPARSPDEGAWSNTQENVFILLALDKYFNAFEKVTPDFVTRIWLGNTYAGEETFKGRSVDSKELEHPDVLSGRSGRNVESDHRQARCRTALLPDRDEVRAEKPEARSGGLRIYGPAEVRSGDKADDVKQNADGSWTIKAGARVRVRLTMVAQARRYHVALVDNLPAGLEILNPSSRRPKRSLPIQR